MEKVMKRLIKLNEESKDVCGVEKKRQRIEFMTGVMAGHQHRVSLFVSKGKLAGSTERVDGHIHKVSVSVDEQGDILGFSSIGDNHKHRIKFKVKEMAEAFKEKQKAEGK